MYPAPGWQYFQFEYGESSFYSTYNYAEGLGNPGVWAAPHMDCSTQDQMGCRVDSYDPNANICIYPSGEEVIGLGFDGNSYFAMFTGELEPKTGTDNARFSVSTGYPKFRRYLHSVQERPSSTGVARSTCFEKAVHLVEEGDLEDDFLEYLNQYCGTRFTEPSAERNITGGNWLLYPADLSPGGLNRWGYRDNRVPNGYGEVDRIGFKEKSCLNVLSVIFNVSELAEELNWDECYRAG